MSQKLAQKNAPTPKQSEAAAQNLRPLVPTDRKASAKAARARLRERENAQYEAMKSGDLAHMPKSEQLPWRVYIRDYVDARFNIGEFFVPFAIVIMICIFFTQNFLSTKYIALYFALAIILYAYLFAAIIDVLIMWRKLRKELVKRYGQAAVAKSSRSAMYACSRAIQMRRWRLPKPSTPKRGNWPK
ncbi:DUF3043 domain-containing protein [Gardnerella pickettii]|uniref:DUF3043 domain-containing protein n=1 Tax=Gardnerella pickettii TaxID=2914924 RepID=UPI0039F004F4